MPNVAEPLVCTVWEDSGLTILARIHNKAGTLIAPGMLTKVELVAVETRSKVPTLPLDEIAAADCVLASPTTDARWTKGGNFNFEYEVPVEAFPRGGRQVAVEFYFTPTSGARFPLVVHADVKTLYGG